jgi:predicted nucleotide-binding protein (sugar kinase/HSP70/actin superfamily)
VLSDPTNKKIIQAGLASVVAEPCFPIIVAHGHVMNLIEKDPDFIFLPNILSQETRWTHTESHLCPWHQTLPFVVRRAPAIAPHMDRFLTPLVPFREGRGIVKKQLVKYFTGRLADRPLPKGRIQQAVNAAYTAQDEFRVALAAKGAETMRQLRDSGEPGIILLGRPYNVHDAGVNLSVATKLRDYYGVNCIPLDFLDLGTEDIRDVNQNMFWDLGRKIIAAAKIVGRSDNLHIIYITNFKCGPDSFIKHFIRRASGKPFLTLQFDGHSNDAGMMTRCEAYLDSKGILRPWRRDMPQPRQSDQINV